MTETPDSEYQEILSELESFELEDLVDTTSDQTVMMLELLRRDIKESMSDLSEGMKRIASVLDYIGEKLDDISYRT